MILQAEKARIDNQLTTVESEIAKLMAELEAKRQSLKALEEAENFAEEALERLKFVVNSVSTISDVAPGALTSLKSAVLNLFPGDGNDSGGNIPTEPTPPVNPNSGEPLLVLDGSVCEFASPLCCQMTDAPESSLTGQSYELCCLMEDAPQPFVELVSHPENEHVAYQRKHDGEIVYTYFGFSSKKIARSWQQFIEAIAFHVELRQAQRMTDCRWELKCKGMSMQQIDRLAKNCDFSKAYQPQAPKAESSAVELGVMPPSDWGKAGSVPVLEKNDTCEVLMGRFTGQIGTVAAINQFSEKPIAVSLPGGHSKHFLRSELKFISKGKPEAQPRRKPLQTGDVLMGDRVVTSGAFVGVSATLRANNAATGTQVDDAFDF